MPPAITLTPMATKQLIKLRNEDQDRQDLCLRVGVRQGGCSGMRCGPVAFESVRMTSRLPPLA